MTTLTPRTFSKHPIVIILLGTFLLILSVVLFKEAISKPILRSMIDSEDLVKTLTATISSVVMFLTYYVFVLMYEKSTFSDFSFEYSLKDSLGGFLLGFGSMTFVVTLLWLLGFYHFDHFNPILPFISTLAFVFGAAILEEIIFRGLVFRVLEKWKGPIAALLLSAIFFQLPHFMNSHTGILPAFLGVLFGLAVGLMYAYKRTLWMPILFHFGWNIVQPVFGTTLSGVEEFSSLSTASLDGPYWLIGTEFGLEVSIFSFLILFILSLYYFRKLKQEMYFDPKIRGLKTI